MKKLALILVFAGIAFVGKTQTTPVVMNSERVGLFTVTNDTMLIVVKDRIVKGSVRLSETGDSCKITGYRMTVGGISSNGVTLKNGAGFNFGFDYSVMDTLKIMCYGKVWISVLKDY
jgi:hypothetical protein